MKTEDLKPPYEKGLTVAAEQLERALAALYGAIVGQKEAIRVAFYGFVWGGHVLVEALPGTGKTLFCRALATLSGLSFKRVQCTPDLLPADVTGTDVLGPDGSVAFREGPVFANVLLVDEINRASPRTQSALLEAMQEHAVTYSGVRRALPEPFFVAATQNPIEMEGTYPLPEAQLDRFAYRVIFAPSSVDELVSIVDLTLVRGEPELRAVMTREDLLALREAAQRVLVPQPVKEYAARLVAAFEPAQTAIDLVKRFVRYGVSVRAAQAMLRGARVHALGQGRAACGFEDVRAVAHAALGHRVALGIEALSAGIEARQVLDEVLGAVPAAAEV